MPTSAKQYDRSYFEHPLFRPRADSPRNRRLLRELLGHKKGGTLLEVGCGKGAFLKQAADHFNVRGMDLSDYAVGHAHPGIRQRVDHGNIEEDALPRDAFDAVVAFNVLEHLRHPSAAVDRIYEGLRADGVFMGSVPLTFGVIGNMHTLIANLLDRTHVATYRPQRWDTLFRTAGFARIHFMGEVMLGKNRNLLLRHRGWPHLAFNLVFVCRKAPAPMPARPG
jgi:2-polyprenyl-3-methyl-5-hydroxy-6-metoxy-1,4-benzoquinol methylase